jgi:holin-like protein
MTNVQHMIRIAFGFGILMVALKLGNLAAIWIPLPGPLIGMVLLACFLAIHEGAAARAVIACGNLMLRYFAFFFIPAGVGVMVYLSQLRTAWFAVSVSLIFSSLLSLIATALTMQFLMNRKRAGAAPVQATAHD